MRLPGRASESHRLQAVRRGYRREDFTRLLLAAATLGFLTLPHLLALALLSRVELRLFARVPIAHFRLGRGARCALRLFSLPGLERRSFRCVTRFGLDALLGMACGEVRRGRAIRAGARGDGWW